MANSIEQTIRFAMKEAGKLQEGADPNGEQIAEWLAKLNAMVNHWQIKGLKLWLQIELEIPLVVNKAIYTIQPGGDIDILKPLKITQAYYQEATSQSRRPLDPPMSREEYTRLGNVSEAGTISGYFVEKQFNALNLYLWRKPDAQAATGLVRLIAQKQQRQGENLTESMEVPQEWFLALYWGLADLNTSGQPLPVQQRCHSYAEQYRTDLEDFDVEDASTSFQPDPRSQTFSRFR